MNSTDERFGIRLLLMAALLVVNSACKPLMTRLPRSSGAESIAAVPPEVSPYFSRPTVDKIPPPLPPMLDLAGGNHPDLYLPSKDHLASRASGWEIYLPYSKYLLHESSDRYIVEASHTFGDGWSVLTPFHVRYFVISKHSGEILRYHETQIPGVSSALVYNGILYVAYRNDSNPPQYWRIPL